MFGVLFAERAVLGHYQSVGIVALVLVAIVVSVLALGTFKSDFNTKNKSCQHFFADFEIIFRRKTFNNLYIRYMPLYIVYALRRVAD